MKTLRMMVAMLGMSLLMSAGIEARKAGAGARAGLPDLYNELAVDKDISGEDLAEKLAERLYKVRGDKNKLRKLSSSYQLFLQKRPLWHNLGLNKDDRNDPAKLGAAYAEIVKKSNKIVREIKEVRAAKNRSAEEEKELQDGMLVYNFMITHIIKEGGRQFKEWKKKNPSKVAEAMEAYRSVAGNTASSDIFDQLDTDDIIDSGGNDGGVFDDDFNLDDGFNNFPVNKFTVNNNQYTQFYYVVQRGSWMGSENVGEGWITGKNYVDALVELDAINNGFNNDGRRAIITHAQVISGGNTNFPRNIPIQEWLEDNPQYAPTQ